jgi:hypothetical protein
LKQPVDVRGHFTTTIPSGNNTPEVGLVQGVTSTTSSDTFYAILAKSPLTQVNSDGTFDFKNVKQGNYDLVWGTANNGDGQIEFLVGGRYPATVGQLCPFNYGDINEAFPKP